MSKTLTVNDMLRLCTFLKKEGYGDDKMAFGYDSNYVYTEVGYDSLVHFEEDTVWLDEDSPFSRVEPNHKEGAKTVKEWIGDSK